MTESPRVSIVVPAYNQARYLPCAIQSALGQSFRDWEIIVVDDGSTEDIHGVVRGFGDSVRYLRQANQGLAGARNTGIREARGEYVALLDGDDEWLPPFVETMMSLAGRHPGAAIFYSSVRYMDESGRPLPQLGPAPSVSPNRMYRTLLRANFLVPSAVVMRRSVVVEEGLFDPAFRRLQDWELWLRLLRHGHGFVGAADRLVRYRLHGAALSTDSAGGRRAASQMAEKLFGPDDGRRGGWPEEKRLLYGGVYRYHALVSLMRENDWQGCAASLRRALEVDPTLSVDLDLFYELVLGNQPMGHRGEPHQLDLNQNAARVQGLLAEVFRLPPGEPLLHRQAWGTASFALGLVAYNADQFRMSRRLFLTALRFRPDLLRDARMVGGLFKSCAGHAGVTGLRRLRGAFGRP